MRHRVEQVVLLSTLRHIAAPTIAALAVALVVSWPSAATAQAATPLALASSHADKTASAAATSLSEQLTEARRQLQQAMQTRDGAGKPVAGRQPPPMQADKQRLLDWLVDLQREKVKRLEELDGFQAQEKIPADTDPLVKALQGPPPYSAIQVNALRDEIDGLQEKLAAAEASHRANQTELQNLTAQRKARSAAARRTSELPQSPGTAGDAEKMQGERDIANLLERITEVEIALTALDQQRLGLQMASMRSRVDEMRTLLASVLPRQRLSPDDLAAQRQRVRKEDERLTGEIDHIAKRNGQRRAERERLGDKNETSGRLLAFLDLAIKVDNAILKGLDHLKILNNVSGDAWEKRYIALTSEDPRQRRNALDALGELRQKLVDWRSLSRTRQDALRTEIRAQRIRVDNLAANSREQGREKELLNLLLLQTATDERTELAATRLERQVSRWLDDLAGPGVLQAGGSSLTWLADGAVRLATRIWQQELFVAEDVSLVDGRQVSVKYGITVGKSVGLLALFIIGHWLLARISRLIQLQLVRWFKLSPQFASVVRRWSMIALSFALVVVLLNLASIPLSVFAFLGGALAIGVGFGAQTIIKNFISGLIVLFERKVRIGDVVELGGIAGYVTAVDLRATTVRAFNGVEALIPNANFIENQVVNWTYSNRQVRRELAVDIAYGTDVGQAEALFLAVAADHPHVLRTPAPEVYFDGFGDSALKVVLVYWVEFDGAKGPRRVDSDLRHGIYQRLAAAGIEIPFPQRDVHVNFVQPGIAKEAFPELRHAS